MSPIGLGKSGAHCGIVCETGPYKKFTQTFLTGTDEKAIIDVLAHRTNEQRQQIKTMFKTMYGRVRS